MFFFFFGWVPFKETLPQLGNGRFCLNDWHAVVPRRLAPAYWLRWQLLREGCGDLGEMWISCEGKTSIFVYQKSFQNGIYDFLRKPLYDIFPPKNSLPLDSSILKNQRGLEPLSPFSPSFCLPTWLCPPHAYQDFAMDASYWAGGAFGGCAPCVPWIWQLFSARGEKISRSYVVLKTLFWGWKLHVWMNLMVFSHWDMFGFSEQLMLSENDFLYFEEVSRCWMQDTKDGAAFIRCLFRSRSHLSMTIICFFQHVSLQVMLFVHYFSSQCPTISKNQSHADETTWNEFLPEVGAAIGRDGCCLLFRTLQQMELQLDAKTVHPIWSKKKHRS